MRVFRLRNTYALHAVIAGLISLCCSRSFAAAAAGTLDDVFRQMILQRLEAHSRGDVEGYRRLLDDRFVHVDDTGTRRTVAEIAAIAQPNDSKWSLGASHTRSVTPSLALVECEISEEVAFGPRRIAMPLMETDLFVKRHDGWRFLEHAETHAVAALPALAVDAAALRDFAGTYEWWPGYRETFTADATELYAQAPDEKDRAHLKAASAESFFVPGDPTLVVFLRNAEGKVDAQLVHFANGRVFVAKKVP